MNKYIRLLRLPDQYPVFGATLASGILLDMRAPWIVVWAIACMSVSIGTFILNELVDRTDVDRNSWNPIHIGNSTKLNMPFAWGLYVGFTLLGLVVASRIGLLWWALVMAVWGGLYSWSPVRLKTIAVFDIVTQIGAWFAIPFGVPFLVTGSIAFGWTIFLSTAFMGWSIIFPYQLADISADKKAGFRSTHILLGVNNSLWLNICFAIAGIALFFVGVWHVRAPWLVVFPLLSLVAVVCTLYWLRLPTVQRQEVAFQKYVGWMKPLFQLLTPYIMLLWFVW